MPIKYLWVVWDAKIILWEHYNIENVLKIRIR